MKTGFISNEELVLMYRESRDDAYLQKLITQNMGLLSILVNSYVDSIPCAEYEDLISESYIPMLRAIEDFDEKVGAFSTLLKVYVRQHLNRLYNEATRKKRHTGSIHLSYEGLAEINKEGGCEVECSFTVECEDFLDVEFFELVENLNLNEKEKVAVRVLMAGGTKGDAAEVLKCTPATATYYFRNLKKKFNFLQYAI